jgi:hypothetical protein
MGITYLVGEAMRDWEELVREEDVTHVKRREEEVLTETT